VEPQILRRAEHRISRRDIDRNVLKVLYRLINAGATAYLVGGGVRDLLLERRPKDFDVGTSAHPNQVRATFRNSRLIGRRFRLVHVFFGPQNIEVATFRRLSEEAQLSGESDPLIRQDNTFGTPEEDALRRDFTVNALFYDPATFRVIDYVGGLADLEARLIRTVGSPAVRMREDPVRMMRAVRFASKLGFEIEPTTRQAIVDFRQDLAKASLPRLVEEIYKTLSSTNGTRALSMMHELGLLEILLPELAAHLNASGTGDQCRTIKNMDALSWSIEKGASPSHALLLACLFLDLQWATVAENADGSSRQQVANDLVGSLRARGFARGDTEQMRLLVSAYPRLIAPSRATRGLIQRPYFEQARELHRLTAENYGDATALERFIANPEKFSGIEHHGANWNGSSRSRRSRQRWRRRGRRRSDSATSGGSAVEPTSAGAPREESDLRSSARERVGKEQP
jgi:poly(A) polymerase